jgi:cytochrome c oxidase assembly factor CtaG
MAHQPFPMLLAILMGGGAILYARGWWALRAAGEQENPVWGPVLFASGLLLIWGALESPLAAMDHQLLTIHMAKHLLLMTVAPALILLASPVRTLARGLTQRFVARFLLPVFRWRVVRQLGRFFTNPIVCWLAAATVLVGWHIPGIFALALRSPVVHSIEHFSFVFAGFLFWWPVLQPWPAAAPQSRWLILLYLFLATLPCDILSAYLTFCDRVVYTNYLSMPWATTISVLRDQEFAGALMWTGITIIYLVPAAILTVRLLAPEPRKRPPNVR